MNLCNLSVIKSLMSEAGISFRKEFGQNFLTNPLVPYDIAESAADKRESLIIEIGPGIGTLTRELAERYSKVVAIEIDKGLIPILRKTLEDLDNVKVINEDVMKVNLHALVEEYSCGLPVSVCANLPYYITTPILMHLLESGVKFDSITIMIQNEVASRLVAKPGSSDYGAITAVLGYYGEAKKLFKVSRGSFVPQPNVDSAVVRIDLFKEPKFKPKNEKLFRDLIRAAFEMRRKTLQNAISAKFSSFSKDKIAAGIKFIGKDENVRGERLSCEDFVKLSDYFSSDI